MSGFNITEVISGDAKGIDTAGIAWAEQNSVDLTRMPANWNGRGKSAGYSRNKKMAWYARATSRILELQGKEVPERFEGGLIAIWKNKSKGTGRMIDLAREFDLKVFILEVDDF